MSRRRWLLPAIGVTALLTWAVPWDALLEKRVVVVVPGRLVRGAWQGPGPLGRIIERERIRTIVTLTAINRDDPKYVRQEPVVAQAGVDWIFVPIRGSHASLVEMAEAADLLADPTRQPVFFHCVAGHHRSSQVHAAYLIRHREFSADKAWAEVAALPWARPEAPADAEDRRLIFAFAAREAVRRAGAAAFAKSGGEPCRIAPEPPQACRR